MNSIKWITITEGQCLWVEIERVDNIYRYKTPMRYRTWKHLTSASMERLQRALNGAVNRGEMLLNLDFTSGTITFYKKSFFDGQAGMAEDAMFANRMG
ncbi:MAG: hypothetical protein WC322_07095 [Candidatus Paceibacterota bacterium]|jgi:hypothetical protein